MTDENTTHDDRRNAEEDPDAGEDPDRDAGRDRDEDPEAGRDPVGGEPSIDPDADPDQWKVLVPVRILENASLPRGLVEFLQPLPVVLMGYYEVPEQTPPGQAQLQFEDRAEDALQEIAEEIEASGGTVETRLVFTDDREASFDRVAAETGADVILLPNPAANVGRVLMPVRSDVDVSRLTGFVGVLLAGREIEVTVYHAAADEPASEDAEGVLSAVADALVDIGLDAESVSTRVEVTDDPLEGIATAAEDHDAVIMGETAPSIASFVFGEFSERVANRSLNPVLVVRSARGEPEPDDESDE